MPNRENIRQMYPFLSSAQAFIIEQKQQLFFGFDALERPVIRRDDLNGVDAIERSGEVTVAKPPLVTAYLQPGSFELTAALKIHFKVHTEFGTDEEVEEVVRRSSEVRNRIIRKLEDLLRLGTQFSDYEVGPLDQDRSIDINPDSMVVTVTALAGPKLADAVEEGTSTVQATTDGL